MTSEATTWAWDRDIPGIDKLILLALADLADGSTFSVDRLDLTALAARCGLSLRTVRSHVRVLESRGFVVEEERRDTRGQRLANRHHLNVRGLAPVALDGISAGWKENA